MLTIIHFSDGGVSESASSSGRRIMILRDMDNFAPRIVKRPTELNTIKLKSVNLLYYI